MNEITPQQALQNLMDGARLAALPFEQHMVLAKSADVLFALINPPPTLPEKLTPPNPLPPPPPMPPRPTKK